MGPSPGPQWGSFKLISHYLPGPDGVLPPAVPAPELDVPEFDVPGFEPGFEVPGFEPVFEVPEFEPGFEVPGLVEPPFGEPFGLAGDPGVDVPFGVLLGLFGFVVEGVPLPGVPGLLELDPDVALPGFWLALPLDGDEGDA